MTHSGQTTLWLQSFALLAMEAGLAGLVATWLARGSKSPVRRRTYLQAGTVAMLLIAAAELSGSRPALVGWLRGETEISSSNAAPATEVQAARAGVVVAGIESGNVSTHVNIAPPSQTESFPVDPGVGQPGLVSISPPTGANAESPDRSRMQNIPVRAPAQSTAHASISGDSSNPKSSVILWLSGIWVLGAALVAARALFARCYLMAIGLRQRAQANPDLVECVDSLSRRLGMRRRVRILASARLAGPIAFGVLRPTVGWPLNFCSRFDSVRQQAMVAHELAHLAAHDPFWCLLADVASAVFWWHPLAWWLRRQLHLASELAADEASLLVAEGPKALAECLVELGARLLQRPMPGHLGMATFRSPLGLRVERLVGLEGRAWSPPSRMNSRFVRAIGSVALVVIAVFCSAWFTPRTSKQGDNMQTSQLNWQNWKRTWSAVVLLATVSASEAASPNSENPTSPAAGPPARVTQRRNSVAENTPSAGTADDAFARRYGLAAAPPSTAASGAAPEAGPGPAVTKPATSDPLAANSAAADAIRRRYGLRSTPASSEPATTPNPLVPTSGSRRGGRIESKLKEIVLSEVAFDNLPLSEVVRILSEECRKRDPEKEGVNFLINPNSPPGTGYTLVDPASGLPIPAEPVDVNSVVIKLSAPIRNVTMKEALDAVVKVADRPVSYSLEDYAVVFSLQARGLTGSEAGTAPAAAASVMLAVRTFRVDTNTFVAGLESTFGIKVETSAAAAARSTRIQSALKDLLTQLGVTVTANKFIYYNDLTGIVMARATVDDLEVIGAAMETLGGVTISNYGMLSGAVNYVRQ